MPLGPPECARSGIGCPKTQLRVGLAREPREEEEGERSERVRSQRNDSMLYDMCITRCQWQRKMFSSRYAGVQLLRGSMPSPRPLERVSAAVVHPLASRTGRRRAKRRGARLFHCVLTPHAPRRGGRGALKQRSASGVLPKCAQQATNKKKTRQATAHSRQWGRVGRGERQARRSDKIDRKLRVFISCDSTS